jgi:hypothetical protein
MENNEHEIVSIENNVVEIKKRGVETLLSIIRAEWQARPLIERVRKLIDIDPGSACQRLFNATIQDLRHKILAAGIDIAQEVAKRYKLPPVNNQEDVIEHYSTHNIIELAYRIGILSRAEWSKIKRCYDIRGDLEHEDYSYEAGIDDVFYIFSNCIQIVLSKDPITIVKLSDIEEIIDSPEVVTPSSDLIIDYKNAPEIRQRSIQELLINTALKQNKADIQRQNAISILKEFQQYTENTVKIEIAKLLQERIGHKQITTLIMKVAYAADVIPYLKQRQVRGYFENLWNDFRKVNHHWKFHEEHVSILDRLEDVGGLEYCPPEIRRNFVYWMMNCFVGERGGYGLGYNRPVFYSNTGARKIKSIFRNAGPLILEDIQEIHQTDEMQIKNSDPYLARRFEDIYDIVNGVMEE